MSAVRRADQLRFIPRARARQARRRLRVTDSYRYAYGESRALAYDAAHQLKTMSVTVPDTTNEMPSTGDEDTTTTTTTYTYDQHANRASDSSKPGPYDYDQANRLKGYRDTTYAYDGDGLRTSKTTPAATQPHTWDITAAIPQVIGDAGTAYITGPDGLPVQQITTDGAVAYYHQDQLGSTRAITNQTASVLATYDYDPYGNPTTKTATLTTPFGYGGQYTDTETGLQYLRARYYDPQTQNFLTRDPITPLTRAPYNYTDNNPTNNTDPTGLSAAASVDGGQGASRVSLVDPTGLAAGVGPDLGRLLSELEDITREPFRSHFLKVAGPGLLHTAGDELQRFSAAQGACPPRIFNDSFLERATQPAPNPYCR